MENTDATEGTERFIIQVISVLMFLLEISEGK